LIVIFALIELSISCNSDCKSAVLNGFVDYNLMGIGTIISLGVVGA
jgi:hypothetical protein